MLEIAATQLNKCTNLEDYTKALRKYLNTGAKAMIEWRDGYYWADETQNEPEDEWTAVLQISDPEEPESFVDLSAFFDKLKGVSDCASFVVSDKKPADEPEPFIECENKLLERFNLTREDLEDIYISRSR